MSSFIKVNNFFALDYLRNLLPFNSFPSYRIIKKDGEIHLLAFILIITAKRSNKYTTENNYGFQKFYCHCFIFLKPYLIIADL